MPSTFSPSLRLELIGNGEQAANWGNTTNTNLGTLLEQAITGVESIALPDSNYTLLLGNGVSDQSRNAVLVLTGTLTAARSVICPSVEKVYLVRNQTTGGFAITIRTAGGTGVQVLNGSNTWVYCDGTNVLAGGPGFNPATNAVSGTMETATRWETARQLTVTGDASGSLVAPWDGSANATLNVTIPGLQQAGVQSLTLANTPPRSGAVTITESDTVDILLGGNVVRTFQGATTRTGNVILTGGDVTFALGYTPVASFNGRTGNVLLNASDVTIALGATAVQNAVTAQTAVTATNYNGNISGGQVLGNISGNAASITGSILGSQVSSAVANATNATNATTASSASRWTTARSLTLSGAVTGSTAGVDGSGNIAVATSFSSSATFTGNVRAANFELDATSGLNSDGATGRSVQFDVGDLIFYNRANNTMDFAIGTVAKLTLFSSTATFSVPVTGPSFTPTSDRALKDDIQAVTGGLSRVLSYQPVSWVWKDTSPFASMTARQSGFVAQDLEPINPLAVVQPSTVGGYPGVDPLAIIADLVNAVQTLTARIEALEAR